MGLSERKFIFIFDKMPKTAIVFTPSTSTVSVLMDGQIHFRIRLNIPTVTKRISREGSRLEVGVFLDDKKSTRFSYLRNICIRSMICTEKCDKYTTISRIYISAKYSQKLIIRLIWTFVIGCTRPVVTPNEWRRR